jgi:hypothetical protein
MVGVFVLRFHVKHAKLLTMLNANVQSVIRVTPAITTVQYSSGDQVGGIMTITDAAFDADKVVKLVSITMLDREQQDANFALFFFDDLPTVVSVDNGAFDITDAEIMAKCVGAVAIASADYVDCDEVAVVQKTPNLLMKSVHADTQGKKSGNLYCLVSTTSTPTYTSTSSLKFVFGFEA